MLDIRMVLTDLDGTVVLPEADSASLSVIHAIRAAQEKGIKISAVTSRPYWMAQALIERLQLVDPCIFDGGAIIVDPCDGRTLWSKPLSAETTTKVVNIMVRRANIIQYGSGSMTVSDVKHTDTFKSALSVWASVPNQFVTEVVTSLKQLDSIAIHINHSPGGDIKSTGIQVTDLEADKEHAVFNLLKIVDIDKMHTLAIGDGDNDLPLFQAANCKVAMGNASPLLKDKNDYVVRSVLEDGFAEAIKCL